MGPRNSPPASSTDAVESLPSDSLRSAISIWLVVHLAFTALSLSAVAGASMLQLRLLSFAAVYQAPLHLAVEGRPIYLTHGEPEDQTHRVQWLREGSESWEFDTVRGYRGSERLRRYSRLAKVIAGAADSDQTAIASLLALPLVHQEIARSGQAGVAPPTRVRIVRLAPDTRVIRYPADPVETARWEAVIVQQSEQDSLRESDSPAAGDAELPRLALVTLKERRLNAAAAEESASSAAPAPQAAAAPQAEESVNGDAGDQEARP